MNNKFALFGIVTALCVGLVATGNAENLISTPGQANSQFNAIDLGAPTPNYFKKSDPFVGNWTLNLKRTKNDCPGLETDAAGRVGLKINKKHVGTYHDGSPFFKGKVKAKSIYFGRQSNMAEAGWTLHEYVTIQGVNKKKAAGQLIWQYQFGGKTQCEVRYTGTANK